MKYLGSKNKIAKHLLPIILKNRKPGQYYVAPFMGGCNMIDKVDGPRIGNDINYYLIEMWKALQNGWIPPDTVTEEDYIYYKKCQDIEDPAMVAFVGFLCSFAGKWFAGYARDKENNNYAARGKKALLKQLPFLRLVYLYSDTYDKLPIPAKSIIYCDPPYKATTGYKQSIDHRSFWQWCRNMTLNGHEVFISEYSAPEDFLCLIEIKHTTIVDKAKRSERIERLFRYEPLL